MRGMLFLWFQRNDIKSWFISKKVLVPVEPHEIYGSTGTISRQSLLRIISWFQGNHITHYMVPLEPYLSDRNFRLCLSSSGTISNIVWFQGNHIKYPMVPVEPYLSSNYFGLAYGSSGTISSVTWFSQNHNNYNGLTYGSTRTISE